jgi:hypothetical protein
MRQHDGERTENPVRFAPVWGDLVSRRPVPHFEPSRSHCRV